MHFARNFILLLCLTMSTSLQLGDKCVIKSSGRKGRCQNLLECEYVWWFSDIPEYCDKSKSQVCCPPSVTYEGTECFDGLSGFTGRCQNVLECNYYALSYRKKPKYCGDSSLCCPSIQLRISEKMCLEYHTEKDTGVSGVQSDNVTVGKKVLRKYGHMAAIGFSDDNIVIVWKCRGSIISPIFILSAAHCAEKFFFGPAKWVRIRDLDQLYSFDAIEDVCHEDFRITETYIHPDYTPPSRYNDIALFKLEKEIIFGDDYRPACLHTETNVPEITEEIRWKLNVPLLRELKVIENKACAILHRFHREALPNGVIDELQICAWDVFEDFTCSVNDFSGPLQYKVGGFENIRGHYVVAGILSFGDGDSCTFPKIPGVYTRISPFLNWIEEIVWGDETEPETLTFVFTN